jgi:hypothetical protein
MYEAMVATARHDVELNGPEPVSSDTDHRERTLWALMVIWKNRVPKDVLVAIFGDLIAQADDQGSDAPLDPSDVFVDADGIARIAVNGGVGRARIQQLIALIGRTLGRAPMFDTGDAPSRARVMSWVRSILGRAATRERVLLAFTKSSAHDPELRSLQLAPNASDPSRGRAETIRRTPSSPAPISVAHAPAARANERFSSQGPIVVGSERRRTAIVILVAIAAALVVTGYGLLALIG